MIDHYLLVQRKLNHYSNYTKNLLASFCEEFQTESINIKRITTILIRLFNNEDIIFKSFFNKEKPSLEMQFINYLVDVGEILNIGNGFYSLPPERCVLMPDGNYFKISSLKQNSNDKTLGMGISIENPMSIALSYKEYLHRPTFSQILKVYENKLGALEDEEPSEIIYFTKSRALKVKKNNHLIKNEFYILFFNRKFRNSEKIDKFFASWDGFQWKASEIESHSHYIRLYLALNYQKSKVFTFNIFPIEGNYMKLNINCSLPKEEHLLLRIFATPEFAKWPKQYIFESHNLFNVEHILSRCELRRER
ncbi:hypothetical protein [Sporosarcina ureae]|uniref:hypothetical protein n=1 Tax=Sporosarcina ureae TaxID=1571 RepID=UPI0026EA3F2B|nr:hypothetical protein [Sporosarcina ureae]